MDKLVFVKVGLYLANPILVSLPIYVLGSGGLMWAHRRMRESVRWSMWRNTLIVIAAVLLICAIVDSAFAYRRVHYANAIPSEPSVLAAIPTPESLVLVNIRRDH